MTRFLATILSLACLTASAQEIVVSSKDNLVHFTDSQLRQMGYFQQSDGDRTYWSKPVMGGTMSGTMSGSSRGTMSGTMGGGSRQRPTNTGADGWTSPPRPVQAPDHGTITPPQGPVQGLRGEKGDKGDPGAAGKDADDQAILLALFQKIKADPAFKGADGAPGKDAVIDYTKLAAAMPPTIVQLMDGNGQVYEQLTFPFGQPIQLPPTIVARFARNGVDVIDQEAYPLGTRIKMRFGAEIIPSNQVK